VDSLAARVSEEWLNAAEPLGVPTGAHSALRRSLGWTLSDDAIAGIAFQASLPSVVAIDGERLITARPQDLDADQSEMGIVLESISLAMPIRIGLLLFNRVLGERSFMVRKWSFGEPSICPIELETWTPLSPWREVAYEFSGQTILEQAARRLGWPLRTGS